MQKEIAEALSKPPAPAPAAAEAAANGAPAQHGRGLGHLFETHVAAPAGKLAAGIAQWCARTWAAFVNWTALLGEFVKRLFLSGK